MTSYRLKNGPDRSDEEWVIWTRLATSWPQLSMSGTTNPDDTKPRRSTKLTGKLKVLPEQPEPGPVPTKRALLAPAQGGEGSNATGDSDDDDGDGGPDEDDTEDVDVRFSLSSLLVLLLWLMLLGRA
jgi:hypothetical protein